MARGQILTLYGSGTGVINLINEFFSTAVNQIAVGKGNEVKLWSIEVNGSDPVQIQVTDDYTAGSPTWTTILEIPGNSTVEYKKPVKILIGRTGKEAFRVNVNGTNGSAVTINIEVEPVSDQ